MEHGNETTTLTSARRHCSTLITVVISKPNTSLGELMTTTNKVAHHQPLTSQQTRQIEDSKMMSQWGIFII
jgi:hypothetical protein